MNVVTQISINAVTICSEQTASKTEGRGTELKAHPGAVVLPLKHSAGRTKA